MKKLELLDALRGFASIYIAISHWIYDLNLPTAVKVFFRFGQEAVIVFFILSGFVICYSYNKSDDKSLRTFYIKRFRRIYFPLFCSFIISIVVCRFVFSYKELIGNILMLQDFSTAKPGAIVPSFLGNSPLWSLSYEWIFYMIFPFIFPIVKFNKNRCHIIGLFSVLNLIIYILFPNHIFLVFSYFLIWWTGLELCEHFLYQTKLQHKTLISYYLVILLILGFTCFIQYRTHKIIEPGMYPYLLFRHFVFAFICLIMTIYFTSFTKKLIGIIKPFSALAPISYGIYIIHYPILVQASFGVSPIIAVIIKILLLFGLAYLIEIVLQPKVNKLIN